MIYDANYILDRIQNGNYTRVDIKTNHVRTLSDPAGILHATFRGDHVKDGVREFVNTSSGNFTFFLRDREGQSVRTAAVVQCNIVNTALANWEQKHYPNEETMRQKIMAELQAEQELNELRQKVETLSNPMNRLAIVAEQLAYKFLGTSMQTEATPAAAMNGAELEEELTTAFEKLAEMFGGDGVVTLVHKLETDDSARAFVTNYLKQ